MVGGLGLALLAVAIIAGLLFRSGAMVVLCLITNLLPGHDCGRDGADGRGL